MNDDDELSPLNQRTFLLTMSPADGQRIAELAGFSPPSEEVMEQETTDVLGKWIRLQRTGILDDIEKSARWLSEIIRQQNKLEDDESDVSVALFTSFGVSLLGMLIDSNKLEVNQDIEFADDLPLLIQQDPLSRIIQIIQLFSVPGISAEWDIEFMEDDDEDDDWEDYDDE
jgi:hypothetical protein